MYRIWFYCYIISFHIILKIFMNYDDFNPLLIVEDIIIDDKKNNI